MKLKNTSLWDSRALRKLVLANIKRAGLDPRGYIVEVRSAKCAKRYPRYTGLGAILRKWAMVGVPKWKLVSGVDGYTHLIENNSFDPVTFSQVLQHELDHNRGLQHKDMPPSEEIDCEWASGFQVEKTPVKLHSLVDLKAIRYAQTLSKIKEKEKIIKRNEKLLKKYYRKKKYYEKQGVGS